MVTDVVEEWWQRYRWSGNSATLRYKNFREGCKFLLLLLGGSDQQAKIYD
jgi:hypothetical protein